VLFDEAPGGQYLIEPRLELFVGRDFIEKAAVDKPNFVRLSHGGIETVKGEGLHRINRRVGRFITDTRCFITQEPLVCNFGATDRRGIYLKSFFPLLRLKGSG
jgi:hypothetical protein